MKKQVKNKPEGAVKLIRKANQLVEARYKFDIWEIRVFTKMLTLIKPTDHDFKLYDIHIGELLQEFKLHDKGDNYQAVRQATKKLMTRLIEIERDTKDGVKWYAMPLLVGAEGFKEPKDGSFISVQFHEKLKPYLLELKERYLQYDISNLWGLSSVYSVRIYELLKQFEKIGKRYFDLDDLRERLAIEPTEYLKYSHFKEKVLLKAQGDLGNSTDISFKMEEQKQGKRVVGIQFSIYPNVARKNRVALPASTEATSATDFSKIEGFEQLKGWGISQETLQNLITEHGEAAVKNGAAYTSESYIKGKVKDNPGGFFIKSVQKGWKSAEQLKQEKLEQQRKKRAEERQQAIEELEKLEAHLEELTADRRADANEVIKILTQDDPFLAGEAVNKISQNSMLKQALEMQTGLKLDGLPMDEWRHNKPLRDAVIRQIEAMNPIQFKGVQEKFDSVLKQLRAQISALKKIIEKAS
jgi:plasmid replication initiation protein